MFSFTKHEFILLAGVILNQMLSTENNCPCCNYLSAQYSPMQTTPQPFGTFGRLTKDRGEKLGLTGCPGEGMAGH